MKKTIAPKKETIHWVLAGPCPVCAAPVLYAVRPNDDVMVRRTCEHNVLRPKAVEPIAEAKNA